MTILFVRERLRRSFDLRFLFRRIASNSQNFPIIPNFSSRQISTPEFPFFSNYHSNSNLEYTMQLRFVKFCAAAPEAANSTSKFFQMSCGSWEILPFSPAAGNFIRQIS